MSFEARVYVQGAAFYVPHTDLDQLVALFPSAASPEIIRDPEGNEICEHHAVVQCRGSLLGLPDLWTTIDISNLWVGVSSHGAPAMELEPDGSVPLLPAIDSVLGPDDLGDFSSINPKALPGDEFDPNLLRAGTFFDVGRFFGDARFRTLCEVRGGESGQPVGELGMVSNTTIVALGEVESLGLKLRDLRGGEESTLDVRPPEEEGERVEIWIRHFCDLAEPDPSGHRVREENRLDGDFALTYTLLERAEELLQQRETYKLPVPQVEANWALGDNLAGRPNQCAGPLGSPANFSRPLE